MSRASSGGVPFNSSAPRLSLWGLDCGVDCVATVMLFCVNHFHLPAEDSEENLIHSVEFDKLSHLLVELLVEERGEAARDAQMILPTHHHRIVVVRCWTLNDVGRSSISLEGCQIKIK